MAGVGGGVEGDVGAAEPDPGCGAAVGPRGAVRAGAEEAGAGGEARGEDEAPVRVRFGGFVTLRRIRPREKREEYLARLERIVATCEEAMSGAELDGAQLKAADVIIRAIRMGYAIVREADVENLEQAAAEIKRILEARAAGGGGGDPGRGPSGDSR